MIKELAKYARWFMVHYYDVLDRVNINATGSVTQECPHRRDQDHYTCGDGLALV